MSQITEKHENIENILAHVKTIAVVGLSSQERKAGFYVPQYLQHEGYRIIPVNPHLKESLSEKAYPNLAAVPEPIDLALIFQRSENVPPFVDQAIEVGAKAVWMQLGIMNEPAAEKARQAGLHVVQNACMLVEHRRWKPTRPRP
jgi:predicted CoA-binding protein